MSSLSASGKQREQRGSQTEATAARPACGPLTPRLAMSPSLADWASTAPASTAPQSAGTHRQEQLMAGCMFTFSFNLPLSISPVWTQGEELFAHQACLEGAFPYGFGTAETWAGQMSLFSPSVEQRVLPPACPSRGTGHLTLLKVAPRGWLQSSSRALRFPPPEQTLMPDF